MLRVLFLRLDAVPTDSGPTRRRAWRLMLCLVGDASKRTNLHAWWIPLAGIFSGLIVPVSLLTAGWVIAIGWMGAGVHAEMRDAAIARTAATPGLTILP